MKKRILTVLAVTAALSAWTAGIPVIDVGNLEQDLVQVGLARKQVEQAIELVRRTGDPALIQRIIGAAETLQHLGLLGPGKSLEEIQLSTTGQPGLAYSGGGLYEPIRPDIPIAGGMTVPRPVEAYRKFEALQQSVTDYNSVIAESRVRRQSLRDAQRQTTAQLGNATTDAEVQKLKSVLISEQSELQTLAAERSEAAARVVIQHALTEGDRMRQEQADQELRAASLQSALRDSLRFFQVDNTRLVLPNPNQVRR